MYIVDYYIKRYITTLCVYLTIHLHYLDSEPAAAVARRLSGVRLCWQRGVYV